MAVISGRAGRVLVAAAPLAEVTAWTFRTVSANRAYASSATGGFRRRLPGVKEGSGQVRFLLDPARPQTAPLEAGARVTLELRLDAARFYRVPAVIDALRLDVDIDRGEVVTGLAEFSTDGAWTPPEGQ